MVLEEEEEKSKERPTPVSLHGHKNDHEGYRDRHRHRHRHRHCHKNDSKQEKNILRRRRRRRRHHSLNSKEERISNNNKKKKKSGKKESDLERVADDRRHDNRQLDKDIESSYSSSSLSCRVRKHDHHRHRRKINHKYTLASSKSSSSSSASSASSSYEHISRDGSGGKKRRIMGRSKDERTGRRIKKKSIEIDMRRRCEKREKSLRRRRRCHQKSCHSTGSRLEQCNNLPLTTDFINASAIEGRDEGVNGKDCNISITTTAGSILSHILKPTTSKSNQIPTKEAIDIQETKNRRRDVMKPISKEQYERNRSIVREVFDEESGRFRSVRGNGEIIERIVTRNEHERINCMATLGDGRYYASRVVARANGTTVEK